MFTGLEDDPVLTDGRLRLAVELLQGIGGAKANDSRAPLGMGREELDGQGAVGQGVANTGTVGEMTREVWLLIQNSGEGDRGRPQPATLLLAMSYAVLGFY